MKNVHEITKDFEQALADYTGAPYVVTVDNMSNALYLCLLFDKAKGKTITIPARTYPSVPCEIIRAGARVQFEAAEGNTLTGPYLLKGSSVVDSALWFSGDMYKQFAKGDLVCVSFTGPYKHLKLGKGGAILTDNEVAYKWLKRARFSGRNECSYHDDFFDMLGINCYMMPEIAARGLLLLQQFYNLDGTKKYNEPLTLPYPDLSQFPIYRTLPDGFRSVPPGAILDLGKLEEELRAFLRDAVNAPYTTSQADVERSVGTASQKILQLITRV